MSARHDDPVKAAERVAVAALVGSISACLFYALELVARPYAQALAAGEAIPYFSRLARGLTVACLAFAGWLTLPIGASTALLRRAGLVLGMTLIVCVLAAVVWR